MKDLRVIVCNDPIVVMFELRSTEQRLIVEFTVDAVSIAAHATLVAIVIWEVDIPSVKQGNVVR